MHSKVVIIGSGPAAHTAAIYLARAELKRKHTTRSPVVEVLPCPPILTLICSAAVLYEGFMANGVAAGGQLTTTTEVENFPGFPEAVTGQELMDKMRSQSERFGTVIVGETVGKLDLSKRPFEYSTEWSPETVLTADAVILATGASARRLGLPGEDKYWQNGISACAVCDGAVPIFRNKPLVVIGGGDSAAEEAMFLTKYGSHVTVLVRRDKLRASSIMARRLLANKKVTVRFNTVGVEVKGNDKGLMSHLVVKDVVSGTEETIEANGLFYAVGHDPATSLVKGQLETDEDGYVRTVPGSTVTSVKGLFAAGDVQDKRYRQAITSAGMFSFPGLGCHVTNWSQVPAAWRHWMRRSTWRTLRKSRRMGNYRIADVYRLTRVCPVMAKIEVYPRFAILLGPALGQTTWWFNGQPTDFRMKERGKATTVQERWVYRGGDNSARWQ